MFKQVNLLFVTRISRFEDFALETEFRVIPVLGVNLSYFIKIIFLVCEYPVEIIL